MHPYSICDHGDNQPYVCYDPKLLPGTWSKICERSEKRALYNSTWVPSTNRGSVHLYLDACQITRTLLKAKIVRVAPVCYGNPHPRLMSACASCSCYIPDSKKWLIMNSHIPWWISDTLWPQDIHFTKTLSRDWHDYDNCITENAYGLIEFLINNLDSPNWEIGTEVPVRYSNAAEKKQRVLS